MNYTGASSHWVIWSVLFPILLLWDRYLCSVNMYPTMKSVLKLWNSICSMAFTQACAYEQQPAPLAEAEVLKHHHQRCSSIRWFSFYVRAEQLGQDIETMDLR
jgi:hypothetical protein